MPVYLHLFHGRDTVDEEMDDWGFDGPTIGPLNYVHTTYGCELKIACSWEVADKFFPEEVKAYSETSSNRNYPFETQIPIHDRELVAFDGKFYGDWSVHNVLEGDKRNTVNELLTLVRAKMRNPLGVMLTQKNYEELDELLSELMTP